MKSRYQLIKTMTKFENETNKKQLLTQQNVQPKMAHTTHTID